MYADKELWNDPNVPAVIVKMDDSDESKIGRFVVKVLECLVKARNMYKLDEDFALKVDIDCDFVSTSAGRASKRRGGRYLLQFNREAILKHWDDMVNDTIPHEIAHIIGYAKPEYGIKRHNKRWKYVCIMLGGTGKRCHDKCLSPGRTIRKHSYDVPDYGVVMLSTIRHNRLQRGEMEYHVKCKQSGNKIEIKARYHIEDIRIESGKVK